MKVCDVVVNSIWYDPRVKKQIKSYVQNGVEIECVGFKDNRYKKEEVEKIPCNVRLTEFEIKKKRSLWNKIYQMFKMNADLYKEIIKTKKLQL